MRFVILFCALALSFGAVAQDSADNLKIVSSEKPADWGNIPMVKYPTTKVTFYGSAIDTSRDWNICTGDTNGGVEVQMVQNIVPIQNCPGDYAVVRVYPLPDGTEVIRQIKRLSDGTVPI